MLRRRGRAVIRRAGAEAPLPSPPFEPLPPYGHLALGQREPRQLRHGPRRFPVLRALSTCRLPTPRASEETAHSQGLGSAVPLPPTRAPAPTPRCITSACHLARPQSPSGHTHHRPARRRQGARRDDRHPRGRSASIPQCPERRTSRALQ